MGVSLQASGLLFRLPLQVLRRFPLSQRGQCVGLTVSGTLMTPALPDVTSGVAIASPVVLALSDSLGYARKSNGSAGLAMAALLGFGQMSPFFLTGAAENLLAWSLLPEAAQVQVTWLSWLGGALVLAGTTLILGLLFTWWLLPVEHPPKASHGLIQAQLEALGPMSASEGINALVLGAAVVGWITTPLHGVSVGWIAMAALTALLVCNLPGRVTFRSAIYWDFLFYLGAALSLTEVVRHLAIDQWLVARLAPILAPATQWPMVFYPLVACTLYCARFVLPSLPLVSLWVIGLLPICSAAGLHPLPLLLVTSAAVAIWFMPYQSPAYLALYFGTKERSFTHRQVRALAWSYGLTYLVGIVLSVPYWRLLGWVP
ncbi:MAG: anion permease [Candidatus Binatia bacterium]|nr:anion permease [Candidatus Binatia bacterium]